MIIQGTNRPIVFTFEESMEDILDIEICLYSNNQEIKHWTLGDVDIDDNRIVCPLTQAETVLFPAGKCTIEVKWMNSYGETLFAKNLVNTIVERYDKTIMEGAE